MTFEKPLEVNQNIKKTEHEVAQFLVFLFWKLYTMEIVNMKIYQLLLFIKLWLAKVKIPIIF